MEWEKIKDKVEAIAGKLEGKEEAIELINYLLGYYEITFEDIDVEVSK